MAHFMNSEISTPLNNDLYTEYADVFIFFCLDSLFQSYLGFDFWKCMCIMVKCQLLLLLLRILLLR